MTVVRRELPLSKGASRPAGCSRRRIVSARTLQSCPHRADAAAPQEADHVWDSLNLSVSALVARIPYAAAARWVIAAQMKPTSSRATATTATGGRLPCPIRWR